MGTKTLAVGPARRCGTGALEAGSATIAYTYDKLYCLTNATYNTGQVFTYTYDAVGNRLTQTIITNTTVYTYDIANRPITITQGATVYTFGYNGLGDRAKQVVNGVPTLTLRRAAKRQLWTGLAKCRGFTK